MSIRPTAFAVAFTVMLAAANGAVNAATHGTLFVAAQSPRALEFRVAENNDAKVYLDRGIAAANKGDLDLAISELDQALQIDPQLAQAFYSRGVIWGYKGNLDRAIADYDRNL